MVEVLIGIFLVSVTSIVLYAYYKQDNVKSIHDLQSLDYRYQVFSNKVLILEQYAEEIFHTAPEDIFVRIEELKSIRDEIDIELNVVKQFIKDHNLFEAQKIISYRSKDNQWEKRGHRLILSICKDLTVDGILVKKNEAKERGYNRKPTFLTLKEIADLLRQEKSVRL